VFEVDLAAAAVRREGRQVRVRGKPFDILVILLEQLPDGHAVRGVSRLWLEWDPDGAEKDLRRAITLNASCAQAHQYLSTVLTVQRRLDEAIASARRAAQLDPLSPALGTTLGYRLYYAGRYDAALEEFARAIELAPEFISALAGQAQTFRELGQAAESFAALQRAVSVAGERSSPQAHLAYAEATRGRRDEARKIQRSLQELAGTRYVAPYDLALVAAGLGDGAAVRSHLERAFADRSGWMLFVPLEREFAPFLEELPDLLGQVRPSEASERADQRAKGLRP
jgi:tetratricopeptide (TPR) repeat protein